MVGIVDIDGICYGDPLLAVGLTNASLLAMKMDTAYVDHWLDELHATPAQRKAVMLYTLIFCIDFMGEQGMKFDNNTTITVNQETVKLLNSMLKSIASPSLTAIQP